MGFNNKPKSIGSGYLNIKEGSKGSEKKKLRACFDWMKDAGVRFSITISQERIDECAVNNGGYYKLTGFMNGFRKDEKSPDIVVYPVSSDYAKRGSDREEDDEKPAKRQKVAGKTKDPEDDKDSEEDDEKPAKRQKVAGKTKDPEDDKDSEEVADEEDDDGLPF